MVLDVKGMKGEQGSTDPADAYREREAAPSRTPKALAAFLTGVGAYLLSLLTPRAEAAETPVPREGEPAPPQVPEPAPAPIAQPFEGEGFWALSDEWESLLQQGAGAFQTVGDGRRPFTLITVSEGGPVPPVIVTVQGPEVLRPANDARIVLPVVSGADTAITPPPEMPRATPNPAKPPEIGPGPGPEVEHPADEDTRNRAPQNSGTVQLGSISACAVMFIDPSDLLAATSDPDGDPLAITHLSASSGSVTVTPGGWSYTPGPGGPRPVTITYRISDGEFSITQTARLEVTAGQQIRGTEGDDLLIGTMCGDEIIGLAGNDNIDGRGGDDFILGGDGDDNIVGGDGNDTIFGGDGRDHIVGGLGDDLLWGGAGDDRLHGGAGDDTLFGEEGDDHLDGGEGDDVLLGGEGDDEIHDGAGRDIVRGGLGDDRVVAAPDGADDIYDGGEGQDTLDYGATTGGVTVDLTEGTAQGEEIGKDKISGFEEIVGGSGDDHFIAGGEAVVVSGNGGRNIFEFRAPAPEDAVRSSHEIRDFRSGDTIRLKEHDLMKRVFDDFEDQFERLYGDVEDDDLMIRVRHDSFADVRSTIIEADLNGDDDFETLIIVYGHHSFAITEYTA